MTYTISAADLRNIRLNQTDALNSVTVSYTHLTLPTTPYV